MTNPIPGGNYPYTPVGFQHVISYAANVVTSASWASTGGGQATFGTTSTHGVTVGSTFVISGMTPAGYNGTYVAISGTTGSTLVAALTTDPGTATGFGTLEASIAAASHLSPPKGATLMQIAVSSAGIRYRDDGVAPTAAIGYPIASGATFTYSGPLSAIQMIAQTGSPVLDVLYYK